MPDAADLDALWPVVKALESLKIQFYIGGSVASNIYGQWRSTNDTDIVAVLRRDHVAPLVAKLSDEYYIDAQMIQDSLTHQQSFNVIHNETAQKVDIFPAKRHPFDLQVLQRVTIQPITVDERFKVPVLSPEDLILSKLKWHREGGDMSKHQMNDVKHVLDSQMGKLDFDYLRRWAAELGVMDLLERAMKESQ